MIGSRLAHYEITSHLGSGGMGEVYQAKDLKLGRNVAVKVLPDAFASDHERIARFEREAKILASLNHPNIASLYGLEEAGGRNVLVMELVEGDTLAVRIERGPIAVVQALDLAQQMAEALEAAHEKGIVHRDLKPANVKLAADGKVKVLDFGLAKAMESAPASVNVSNSPTLTAVATLGGVILGTAAYMSPEQARGEEADVRSDCFSFGCVLYEMLSGRRAFQGKTASDILASVLAREPDFTLLPSGLHPSLLGLLRRCFEKEPRRRWQAMGDVRLEIEAIRTGGAAIETHTERKRPLWQRALTLVGTAIAGALITAAAIWSRAPAVVAPAPTRFSIAAADANGSIDAVAISTDGTQIVYAMNKRLYLRHVSESEARPIPGSEFRGNLSAYPDFSPDGRWIIFVDAGSFQDAIVKRIAPTGGTPDTVYRGSMPWGLNWGEGGIVFWQDKGLVRVSPNGGQPELLLGYTNSTNLGCPEVLPGGRVVLFAQYTDVDLVGKLVAQPLKSGEPKTLVERGGNARYLSTGHLVYGSAATLNAVAFDADSLDVSGEPVPVVEGIRIDAITGAQQFDISDTGSLTYLSGPVSGGLEVTLRVLDRKVVNPLDLPPDSYRVPRVSPDGRRIVYGIDSGKEASVYVYDLTGGTSPRRLTFTGANRHPIWLGNETIAFQSDREGDLGVFSQRVDGSGSVERVTRAAKGEAHVPDSWSAAAQAFSYTVAKETSSAVWVQSLRDGKATLFADGPTFLGRSVFSPDGRWLAYHTFNQALGASEVFVQAFPMGARHLVAKNVAHSPLWSRDGRELFYIYEPGKFASVRIATTPAFSVGNPVQQSMPIGDLSPLLPRMYDLTSDGRFLTIGPAGPTDAKALNVVLNWFEDVKQRVAAR